MRRKCADLPAQIPPILNPHDPSLDATMEFHQWPLKMAPVATVLIPFEPYRRPLHAS